MAFIYVPKCPWNFLVALSSHSMAEPLSPACKGMSQVTSMSHIFLGHFNYLKLLLIFYINCNNPINNVSK